MAKQTTKRCHLVPQSYLRTFAATPDTRQKIWRFSKTGGNPELKPIEKVAVKFHLYAPKGFDGRRDDWLEKKLAHLETWFSTSAYCIHGERSLLGTYAFETLQLAFSSSGVLMRTLRTVVRLGPWLDADAEGGRSRKPSQNGGGR